MSRLVCALTVPHQTGLPCPHLLQAPSLGVQASCTEPRAHGGEGREASLGVVTSQPASEAINMTQTAVVI